MNELVINEAKTPGWIIGSIIAVSAVASIFICWLVYAHQPFDAKGIQLDFLPGLNAILNALCTVALLLGFYFICTGKIAQHKASMFAAFIVSSLFLASYLTNYVLHTEIKFQGHGAIRWVYFPLLISHIILAVVALPMVLITFFLSLSGRFPAHRKLARWTFPVWLYVSVTGVVVYLMLAAYR